MLDASLRTPRQLPLHTRHLGLGARIGLFGEWEVPLFYTSILDEHEAVRTRSGLFDISHMGEFFIEGPGAKSFLDWALPRPVSEVAAGRAVYAPLLNELGGIVDDVITYRLGADRFLLIVNAGNVAKDFVHLQRLKIRFEGRGLAPFTLIDSSEKLGLLALQGPASLAILSAAVGQDFGSLGYYRFCEWKSGIVSRTGYTGEDGFEIMVPLSELELLWTALMSAGKSHGLSPVGFGCRDTLRLEAGMPLYGHDMDDETAPMEAGIGWAVKMNGADFFGREALTARAQSGWRKKLIGFEMLERGIPRQGQEIFIEGCPAGVVTSGSFSPTLKENIGMGFVNRLNLDEGEGVDIQIRGAGVRGRVVAPPFYRRLKS